MPDNIYVVPNEVFALVCNPLTCLETLLCCSYTSCSQPKFRNWEQ